MVRIRSDNKDGNNASFSRGSFGRFTPRIDTERSRDLPSRFNACAREPHMNSTLKYILTGTVLLLPYASGCATNDSKGSPAASAEPVRFEM